MSNPRLLELNTAEFVHSTPNGDDLIAEIARVSNPANQGNKETAPRLIAFLIKNNHWSPFQMCSMAIEVNTTRDIGRQILRHLSAIGYQEFSGRYAEYGQVNQYRECRFQHPTNRQLSREAETEEEKLTAFEWDEFIVQKAQQSEREYKYWLGRGVAKEQARAILPEGLVPTRLYLHYSIRTWLHYIEERVKMGVQKEHRVIAEQCHAILREHYPQTAVAFFGDQ